MRIGYLECFAGIAGDMFLGALCDAGVDQQLLQKAAEGLGLGVTLEFSRVDRSGIQSTKVRVLVGGKDADGGLPEESSVSSASHAHTHTQPDGSVVAHSHAHTHTHAEVGAHAHTHTHPDGTVHSHAHTHASAESHEHTHTHDDGHAHSHGRSLPEIRTLIEGAAGKSVISDEARRVALAAFGQLGRAEAKIHGVPVETIHFHEVGAVDAIVDIVCGAVGATSLGVEQWYASAVNTGSGFVNCAHGRFPVPAPATVELLAGIPVYAEGPAKEMTTPTGAALLLALGCCFDALPVLKTTATGYGAGTRNPEGFPNVLRLRIGETVAAGPRRTKFATQNSSAEATTDQVTVLECAIDDATPEVLAHATQMLLAHGALDVMQQAVMMKKGRHGTLLTVLCASDAAAMFEELLFRETTTLGVRRRDEQRSILERKSVSVETEFGAIRMKLGIREGRVMNAAPEFEDCRESAGRHGVALKDVMQAAHAAWHLQSHPAMVNVVEGAAR